MTNAPLFYIVALQATPNGGWAECSVNPHSTLESAESLLIQSGSPIRRTCGSFGRSCPTRSPARNF
jgi:hypothetical protein